MSAMKKMSHNKERDGSRATAVAGHRASSRLAIVPIDPKWGSIAPSTAKAAAATWRCAWPTSS